MTDFIPFGTPPGSTGNPKSIIADEFQLHQKIKVDTMAQVSGDTNGTPPNPSRELTAEASIMNPHTPDLRPIYLNLFAITTNPDQWGVSTYPSWAKTGTTGNNTTTTNNGRLIFINNGGYQDAANGGIARYIISNAGGITNFGGTWAANVGDVQGGQGTSGETGSDAVKGYNINSFSTMQAPYVRDYRTETRALDGAIMGGNGDGTDVDDWPAQGINSSWLPTVFTSDGATGSTQGDSLDAWRVAINQLDTYASNNGLTSVQKIHQWDWPACYAYSSNKADTTAEPVWDGGYDRLSAAVDFQATTGSLRWAKPGFDPATGFNRPFDTGFWDYEVHGFIGDPDDLVTTPGLGFNGLTWGVSGNSYQEFDDRTLAAEQVKAAYPNVPFLFEASPMQSTGTGVDKVFHQYGTTWDLVSLELSGMPDQRYTAAAHWGFFPSYYTTEQYSTNAAANGWTSDGGRWIDNIWWDPSIHEQHILFDAGYLIRTVANAPNGFYSWDDLKDMMIFAWQHGFVVGVSSLSRSGGSTPAENLDICQFVTALNTFTSADGIDTSTATHPVGGGAVTRYSNPALQKAIPTQP